MESRALWEAIEETKELLPNSLSSLKEEFYKEESKCELCSNYESLMDFDENAAPHVFSEINQNPIYKKYRENTHSDTLNEGWYDRTEYCYCPVCHNVSFFFFFSEENEETGEIQYLCNASDGFKNDTILNSILFEKLLLVFVNSFLYKLSPKNVYVYFLAPYNLKKIDVDSDDANIHHRVAFFSEKEILNFVNETSYDHKTNGIARTKILESDLFIPSLSYDNNGLGSYVDDSNISFPNERINDIEFYNFSDSCWDTLDPSNPPSDSFFPLERNSNDVSYLKPYIILSLFNILKERKA